MVVKSSTTRPMVVCYPPDDVPMIEDPKRPGHFKPDVTWLITEDDTPVDGRFSELQMQLLTEPLGASWFDADGKKKQFVAMSNVGLFYLPTEPPLVPDVMLSVGVTYPGNIHEKAFRSYFVWEYPKVPDAVVEIVSNREGGEDTRKLRLYPRIGIPWYIIFDPEQHLASETLRIYHRNGDEYEKVEDRYFPDIGLGIAYWEGLYVDWTNGWIRWCYEDGTLVPTGEERAEQEKQRAEQEKQRAEQEKQRAEQEKQRAEQEKQRADKLAAKLRGLGIDPSVNGS
jgi:hypothetical protein